INQGSVENGGNAFIVTVTEDVITKANQSPETGFPTGFKSAGALNTDVIRRGDQLRITVYENVEQGVLGTVGTPSTISELTVDQSGNIFVPYAGTLVAAGKTIEGLRVELTQSLENQTPDPQVQLARATGGGANVTVLGQGAAGVFEIEPSSRRLSQMLAASGAINPADDPAGIIVSVKRGSQSGEVFLSELFSDRSNDIFLRPGDQITVRRDERRFTLLGALPGQGFVSFPQPTLSVLEAISLAGGLSAVSSDPRGIFVFRDEAPEFASAVLADATITTTQRMVYVVDLTDGNGIFRAREFKLKDGDTLVVTEAPFSQWTKAINAILSTATTAENLTNIGNAAN
ncbi:MAG: polysaccharide biosynthesis/export family protein, partial [Pseudomonadota bacterium]